MVESSIGTDPEKPARLYIDGIFDLAHYGHMRALEQCKKKFPYVYLIVGIAGDEDCATHRHMTVMKQRERYEFMLHVKWVDEIVCPCPWSIDADFLERYAIDFVCHDEVPYKYGAEGDDLYQYIKEIGKFLPIQRTQEVETTDMIEKVLVHADYYSDKVLSSESNVTLEQRNQIKQAGKALKDALEPILNP